MLSSIRIHENSEEDTLLNLINNKKIGIITGKLRTLMRAEFFFTWWAIAAINVKQLDILRAPINKRMKKKGNDVI